jgi:hypothetical protein
LFQEVASRVHGISVLHDLIRILSSCRQPGKGE